MLYFYNNFLMTKISLAGDILVRNFRNSKSTVIVNLKLM